MSHIGWDISHPTFVHYIVMSVIRSNTLFGHLYVSVKQEMNNFSNDQRTSQNLGQNPHHQTFYIYNKQQILTQNPVKG